MNQDAYAALPSVKSVAKVYPDNKELKALLLKLEQSEKAEKDNRDYKYVE